MKQEIPFTFTNFQMACALYNVRNEIQIWGRNTGKTRYQGYKILRMIENLPGASGTITAQTFTHLFTGILPGIIAFLESAGLTNGIHYKFTQPPKDWKLPFEPPAKFDKSHYMTFFNPIRCVGFHLFSQDKEGGARGPNTDFEFVDEFINIKWDRYYKEVAATNRANRERFKHIKWHNGKHFSSSMPYTHEGKAMLKHADYYMLDYGINYLEHWKKTVRMQLELLNLTDKEELKLAYNELVRHQQKCPPKPSKDGSTLFSLSNCFDNNFSNISWVREQKKNNLPIIFLVEIMNMILDNIEDCFYNCFSKDKHVFYDSFDDSYLLNETANEKADFSKLMNLSSKSLNPYYYHKDAPLSLFFDWGGRLSYMIVAQRVKDSNGYQITCLKEFYTKPDAGEMVERLLYQFVQFFESHVNKSIDFISDNFGNIASNKIATGKTINDIALDYLRNKGWSATKLQHAGQEPPHFEKYTIINNCLQENKIDQFDRIRIDGNLCKYLILSIENTKLRQVDNQLKKDKSDERDEKLDQLYAQHPGDAFDKGIYYYHTQRKKRKGFIPVNA